MLSEQAGPMLPTLPMGTTYTKIRVLRNGKKPLSIVICTKKEEAADSPMHKGLFNANRRTSTGASKKQRKLVVAAQKVWHHR